ncbi:hypothetical protein [Haloflavibacter putidus]|uniref:hypothetical protein n=1 Tax=Haloflavibacter putidus TaxID=2576776 RepID=UPI001F373396|nr:hypothetical protein [Haloflavibacter putidus]
MKEPFPDFLAIASMAAFAILAYNQNWWQDYTAFVMIPLLVAYFLGRYIGGKNKEK